MHFREGSIGDVDRIVDLYKKVALDGGGIARRENEITREYVSSFIEKATTSGMIIVCEHPENPDHLIAEVHAYQSGLAVFDHVMGDLTLVVHPELQGKKIGRTILTIFLNELATTRPDVGKVELVCRESNTRAIQLYQSLGFRIEGRMEMRIKTADCQYEADIPMGWQNPNFEF